MIIAFGGKARSGKTTASDYVTTHYKDFVKINFKDSLVEEMRENFPDVLDSIASLTEMTVDELFAEKPPIMRELMQNYGTEVRRKDHPNYWVIKWAQKVNKALSSGKNVVLDDCRFLNEASAVKDIDGHTIKIVRTDITDTGKHQSETEMEKIKYDEEFICDKGEHEKLYGLIDNFIREQK